MSMEESRLRVLLVDDDYEDYLITKDLFAEFRTFAFELEWVSSYDTALAAIEESAHDVYLLDYRLGTGSGLDLLRKGIENGCGVPMILLTGQGDHDVDMEAMKAGAADFLVKGKIDAALLERSIRYAVERKRAEEQVMHAAYYDNLTMLPNRLLFNDRLLNTLILAGRNRKEVAVLFLDLDNFKRINDTLGHRLGDLLLKDVAARMTGCVRKSDTISRTAIELLNSSVARMGGDEFAVLLPELSQFEDAARVVTRILEAMSHPFSLEGHDIFITTSAGIAIYPFDGADVDTLLKNADTAMYHAKSQGKNNFRFYEQQMNAAALERLSLENDLHRALERQELLLYYQPQRDIRSGKIVGLEALIRWQHPEMGMIPPDEFIPLAEETGLIIPIGEWALATACAQNSSWQAEGIPPIRMAVNISTHQLRQQDLRRSIVRILEETGLPPQYLELELTESIMMQNIDANIKLIHELKDMGLRFTIDDFGTGYSSFIYLKQLPMEAIKIDRSFVRDITSNADDAAIVTAIIAMSHSLKLRVVAEGVETEGQLALLQEKGCDVLQGYLLSRPMPAEETSRFLRAQQVGLD
jgi:diguanylate cyclase (GGDEF)-like protein